MCFRKNCGCSCVYYCFWTKLTGTDAPAAHDDLVTTLKEQQHGTDPKNNNMRLNIIINAVMPITLNNSGLNS